MGYFDDMPTSSSSSNSSPFADMPSSAFSDMPSEGEGLWEGLIKPTLKAVPRVVAHTAASFAQMPISGVAAGAKLISSGGDLNAANQVLEENQKTLDDFYLKTPEERQGSANIGLAMDPFKMAGEGWQEIIKQTPLKGTIAEPIAGAIGEASAMFGLGGAKGAIKGRLDTAFRPIENVIPETQGRPVAITPETPKSAFADMPSEKPNTNPLNSDVDILDAKIEQIKVAEVSPASKEIAIKSLEKRKQGLIDNAVVQGKKATPPAEIVQPGATSESKPWEMTRNDFFLEQQKSAMLPGGEGGIELPSVYVRFGRIPETGKPSMNHLTGKPEKGVSVYKAWFDKKTGKYVLEPAQGESEFGEFYGTQDSLSASGKKTYLVTGDMRKGHGYDLEPLLDTKTAKTIKELSPDDIVLAEEPYVTISGKELDVIPDWANSGEGVRMRNHRTEVRKALSEGKPVPPEVLKDYPKLAKQNEIPVIDEETYLTQHGASRQDIGESALHKNIPEGNIRKRLVENQAAKDRALVEKRDQLRKEYNQKVEVGEIRPPTRNEKLIGTANGHPDNASVQAARRILEKNGIEWNKAQEGKGTAENLTERAARVRKETVDKFAEEAASTETITQREVRRKQEGEKVAEKVIPVTKKAETNIITPKEQKVYVLDKIDDAIANARKQWREEMSAPKEATDADIDVKVFKGTFGTNTAPEGAQTIVIDVPNDGQYKIPNTLKNLLNFQKKMKAMSTSSEPPNYVGKGLPSKKPTGKSLPLIEKEAAAEYQKYVDDKAQVRRDYEHYTSKGKEDAQTLVDKWQGILDDVANKKIPLKSLSNEFNGKTPSYKDVSIKRGEAFERLKAQDKYAKDTKDTIKENYPSMHKEMFETKKGVLSDINTLMGGERGSISNKGLSPEQLAAKERLDVAFEKFKEEAKKTGKEFGEYIKEVGLNEKAIAYFNSRNKEQGIGSVEKPAKLAQSLDQASIDKGVTNTLEQNLSTYLEETGMMESEFNAGKALYSQNPDLSFKMAMGDVPQPEGMRKGTMWKTVSRLLLESGDIDGLYKLKTESKVPKTLAVEAGREVKSFDLGISDNPLRAFDDIVAERTKGLEKTGKTPVSSVKVAELEKALADKQKAFDDYVSKVEEKKVNDALDEIVKPKYKPVTKEKYGSKNKVVTQEAYLAAKASLREKFAQQTAGIDPTIIKELSEVGAYHLEAGTREFATWSKRVLEDVGEWAKPHLEDVYKQVTGTEKKTTADTFSKRITKAMEEGKDAPAISGFVQKLSRQLVEEGITDRDVLVKEVHNILKDIIPEITPRETADAVSGYGKYKQLSKDDISIQLRDLKGQLQQVSKLDDLERKGVAEKTGMERRIPSDEERRLVKLVDEAKKKYGIETIDPETQLRTKQDALKKRLVNEIKDLSDKFKNMDFAKKESIKIIPDADALKLKAERDIAKKNLKTGSEAAVAPTKEQVEKLIELSQETAKTRAEMEKGGESFDDNYQKFREASIIYDNYINKLKGDSRTPFEKAMAFQVKWRRFLILSSVKTIGKLTSAASSRFATSPVEDIAAGFWSHVPGVSKVMAKSPRFSGGLNIKAEAKAFSQFVAKQTYRDIIDTAKTGKGQLDILYGQRQGLPPEALDFFGHLHGSLKVIPKRAEFYRSLEKRTTWELKNGTDMTSPIEQIRVCTESLTDANRAILMNKNVVTDAYSNFLGYLTRQGTGGKLAKTGLQNILPIVRVPTNYVAEVSNYALGVPKATIQVMKILIEKDGLKNLSREQADNVARSFAKGSVGAGLFLIGYFNDQNFGGYYQQGEKRSPRDISAGGLKIGDAEIPHFLLHIPAVEVMQLGASVHRIIDKKGSALAAGLGATTGLASQVPFLETPTRMVGALKSEKTATKFITELGASLVIPPDVYNIAQLTDKDSSGKTIQRKPKNAADIVKQRIPGLRQDVPRKAEGGEVKAGKPYLMGEKGTELLTQGNKTKVVGKQGAEIVVPKKKGKVIPHKRNWKEIE